MKQLYTEEINNLDDFFGDCFGVVYLLLEGDTFGYINNTMSMIKQCYYVPDIIKFIEKNRKEIIERIGTRSLERRDKALREFEELLLQ